MQTTISARHCEIPGTLRERAAAVLDRLGTVAPRPIESTVVFDSEANRPSAELRLHLAHGEILIARGEGEDHRSALDQAEAKLRRQLVKAAVRPRRTRASQPKSR